MTRQAQARSVAALAIAVVILVVGFTAAEEWTSYLDPSLISEIALSGGELYLATGGGLVIFDPATFDVEQFTNTIGLPSTFLTCLTFDSKGDIYVGTEDAGMARLQPRAGQRPTRRQPAVGIANHQKNRDHGEDRVGRHIRSVHPDGDLPAWQAVRRSGQDHASR